jgi:hypothetical protein
MLLIAAGAAVGPGRLCYSAKSSPLKKNQPLFLPCVSLKRTYYLSYIYRALIYWVALNPILPPGFVRCGEGSGFCEAMPLVVKGGFVMAVSDGFINVEDQPGSPN